jgi:hypothetical protein
MKGTALPFGTTAVGAPRVADPSNDPLTFVGLWMDNKQNNLWIFGGINNSAIIYYGTLWKYSIDSNTGFGWMDQVLRSARVYGTQGFRVHQIIPGKRMGWIIMVRFIQWLWLFGGYGYDASGNLGALGDLWEYNEHENGHGLRDHLR